jgi:hypothetical protein
VELVAILECYCGQPDAPITAPEEPQEHYDYHPIQARIGQCVPPGTVFQSFHCKETPANLLTQGFALDPPAKNPEYKSGTPLREATNRKWCHILACKG